MKLALPLAGIMVLWLGLMRLAERAGLVQVLARILRPALRLLFPDVPTNHPAMGSMVMNMAANMLGLANAATPLGLRAMKDLETLNPRPGVASNAMCTFLAINTSSVQLLPLTAIGVLAVNNASNPSIIVGPAILATICSTIAGIAAVKWMERWRMFRLPDLEPEEPAETGTRNAPSAGEPSADIPVRDQQSTGDDANKNVPAPVETGVQPMALWGKLALFGFLGCFAWLFFSLVFGDLAPAGDNHFLRAVKAASVLAVPFLIAFFPLFAALKRIKVYEEFIEGGKEGLQVAFRIVPYLVAILVAVGMFRGAGGIDFVTKFLRPVLGLIAFPSELVPMCLMRPLSGSGTLGMFTDLVQAHGANSLLATMGGSIFGSTETTLYVVAVYFGSVSVRRSRHAVPAGLFADGVGMIASVWICRLMFG